ncbi:MAG: PQQ-dependent sugar dehydrogenase [Archangium sp.]
MTRALTAVAFVLVSCAKPAPTFPTSPAETKVKGTVITSGLVNPWAVAFLPDGRFLVTEKGGALRYVTAAGEKSAPLNGVPSVETGGQGGLLDVVLAPDFATSSRVYFTYSEKDGDVAGTALATAILGADAVTEVKVLWRQTPKLTGGNHYGSRIVFSNDGKIFVAVGERNQRDLSQKLDHAQGKVVRLNTDGTPVADNPFISTAGALKEIWSYGHRNIQGAALNPTTGELWTNEHGPMGGDEVNITRAGKNYGWPLITYGREYSGGQVGTGATSGEGLEQPLHYWVPSIATSGMAFVTKDVYPSWKGSVLIGGLAGKCLSRLVLDGERVTKEERLLTELGERIRDVREAPDGRIYVLTDEANGKLYRIDLAE